MIKHLKLKAAVVVVILGLITLVAAKLMESNKIEGDKIVLGISGGLLIVGALMFLYPILFAKRVGREEDKVTLTPIAKDNGSDDL